MTWDAWRKQEADPGGDMARRPGFISPAVARRAMERQGLSVTALAVRVGVSAPTVRNWLSGRTSPGPGKLSTLAQVLEIHSRDLTGVAEGRETLADLRIHAALTQAEACRRLDVGQTTLSDVENGVVPISDRLRSALATLYTVPEDRIVAAWTIARDTLTA